MGTVAEAWLEQGKAEGLVEGRAEGLVEGKAEGLVEGKVEGKAEGLVEGKAATLTRLLERRFGPLPRELASRISAADLDELDTWLDRVLDAGTLDAVFGSRAAH